MFLLLEEKKSYYAQYSSQVKEKRYVLLLHTLGGVQEPLFLAKDVAKWIENSNTSQMVRNIDEDEKIKQIAPIYNVYNGQYENQECLFLTEDGLYEVLMQSRKQNINDRLYVNSKEVAEMVGKDHDKLLRDIRKYKEILDNTSSEHCANLHSPNFFVPATYKNSQNRDMPCYLLTRKGCDMVANKMTGEKGA